MESKAVSILDSQRTMTIATLRPDGWPQATIVGYANEGLLIYFLVSRHSQKLANILHDQRVALSIGCEAEKLADTRAVYAGAKASEVTDAAQRIGDVAPEKTFAEQFRDAFGYIVRRRKNSRARPGN